MLTYSIYKAHDDAKDKEFELELTWVGAATSGRHEAVPAALRNDAIAKAKQALDDEMED